MFTTIESLQARINLLQERNPSANEKIIKKLKRRIRLMENK